MLPSGSPEPLRRHPSGQLRRGASTFLTRARVLAPLESAASSCFHLTMRVTKLTGWLVAVLLLPSCTSTAPDPAPSSTSTESIDSTEDQLTNPIESVFIAGPSSLVLSVSHSSCREVVPRLSEFPDRVEVAALSGAENEQGCAGMGQVSSLNVELEAPLADRQLVLRVPEAMLSGIDRPATCVYASSDHWCVEALMKGGNEEAVIGSPRYSPMPLVSQVSQTGSLILSTGTVIDLRLDEPIEAPYIFERRGIWRPDLDLWGSLGVHNVSRPLQASAKPDRLVAGYPAYWVTAPEDDGGAENAVTIQVDNWFVDVLIWTKDSALQRTTIERFLDGLSIEERASGLPSVVDAGGWIGDTQDLAISDVNGNGFVFTIAPNCEPAELASCIAGSGFTTESSPLLPALAAGVVQLAPTPEPMVPPRLVSGDIRITSFGEPGDVAECTGVPALPMELLPRSRTLDQARGEIQILTGITSWQARSRPGVETTFTGAVDDPEVVVTYIRNSDGTWSAASAVSCSTPGSR